MFLLLALLTYSIVGVIGATDCKTAECLKKLHGKKNHTRGYKDSGSLTHRPHSLYGYDGGPGVKAWKGACRTGISQSPIDFKLVEHFFGNRLEFSGIDQLPLHTEMKNTGHSVQVKLKTISPIRMSGGPFHPYGTQYEFEQFHFHWGRNINEGSEHTVASRRFPMECHMVFRSVTNPNRLAVIGFFYKVDRYDSPDLNKIVKHIFRVEKAENEISFRAGSALRRYMPENVDLYHHYKGSLTTPPCTEGVDWLILMSVKRASQFQISEFRKIKDDRGFRVLYNFRPTMALNRRPVFLTHAAL